MKVLLTGANGQAGRAIARTSPSWVDLKASTKARLDIRDDRAVRDFVQEFRPDVVINAAAYTNVDQAETDRATAKEVNADAVRALALAARSVDARLIHLSTDYVFGGATDGAFSRTDAARPINEYGRTKEIGERYALQENSGRDLVLRTSWLYSNHGHNFVQTMLRLMESRDSLRVVADQISAPTSADSLAMAVWACVEKRLTGVHHWRDAGVASWYDFANAIRDIANETGLLRTSVEILAIQSDDYPTAARRPKISLLDSFETERELGLRARHWRENLTLLIKDLSRA